MTKTRSSIKMILPMSQVIRYFGRNKSLKKKDILDISHVLKNIINFVWKKYTNFSSINGMWPGDIFHLVHTAFQTGYFDPEFQTLSLHLFQNLNLPKLTKILDPSACATLSTRSSQKLM